MRFAEVVLASPAPGRVLAFYEGLGFEVRGDEAIVGRTRIRVLHGAPEGAVHLAFNVPEHRFADACAWIAARAPLVEGGESAHSDEWDADGTYFLDPDANVLELIARHRRKVPYAGPFGTDAFEGVSEVGVPTFDVPRTVEGLCAALGERPWLPASATFGTLGDEEGLLIVAQAGRPWFPSQAALRCAPLAARLDDGRDVPLGLATATPC